MIMMGLIIRVILIGVAAIILYLVWTYRRQIKDILAVRKHWHKGDALLID